MKILIVDDETLARERLQSLLNELGFSEKIYQARNGKEALNISKSLEPNIIFLDVRMPGMDGMETAKQLMSLYPCPAIIFTTAFEEHALDAFEYQAVDYLLKPIRKERLERAIKRANLVNQTDMTTESKARSHISVTIRGELRLIPVNQIYYFRADEKFVIARWEKGEVLIAEPLKTLEKEFCGQFLRIHRSRLVAVSRIIGLTKDGKEHFCVKLDGLPEELQEVSRRHLPMVRKMLKDMRLPTVD